MYIYIYVCICVYVCMLHLHRIPQPPCQTLHIPAFWLMLAANEAKSWGNMDEEHGDPPWRRRISSWFSEQTLGFSYVYIYILYLALYIVYIHEDLLIYELYEGNKMVRAILKGTYIIIKQDKTISNYIRGIDCSILFGYDIKSCNGLHWWIIRGVKPKLKDT